MEYDFEGVKSIKLDQDNDEITIVHAKGRTVLTSQEVDNISMKSVGWTEDGSYYFNGARCSLDKERKELVCGN